MSLFLAPILRPMVSRQARESVSDHGASLVCPELIDQVEVLWDEVGCPTIYASNDHDAFLAQGYVHAQDRMFQMELARRVGHGRLAEILGPKALQADIGARQFGWGRLAQGDYDDLDEDTKHKLQGFCAGVNLFIKNHPESYPIEVKLGKIPLEEWTPADSLVIARYMFSQLGFGFFFKIMQNMMVEAIGEEHVKELDLAADWDVYACPTGNIEWNKVDWKKTARNLGGNSIFQDQGSNAWAVSGSRSTTGHALFGGDPHLGLKIPNQMYLCNIVISGDVPRGGVPAHCGGGSIAGTPGILLGHNDVCCWTQTVALVDVEDVYIEQFLDDRLNTYQFNGEVHRSEVREEVIHIKGQREPHVHRVVETHHGPVISDVVPQAGDKHRMTICSVNLKPKSKNLQTMFGLMRVDSFESFRDTLEHWSAPPLNMIYADTHGNIGYHLMGDVPERPENANFAGPVPGWSSKYEWVGMIPHKSKPHVYNPECGYVISCNNRPVGKDYPFPLGNLFHDAARARRGIQLLEAKEKHSFDDMIAYQLDVKTLAGPEFIRAIPIEFTPKDSSARWMLEQLRAWDGDCGVDSVASTLYHVLVTQVIDMLLTPVLPAELMEHFRGNGFDKIVKPLGPWKGHDVLVVKRMIANHARSWFVKKAGGLDNMLNAAFAASLSWLRSNLGSNKGQWTWGRIHNIVFEHPFTPNKMIGPLFTRGEYQLPGDGDTLRLAGQMPGQYYSRSGPCFRQVHDLRDWDASKWVVVPGNSGQLNSPHYDDQTQAWLTGKLYPWTWHHDKVLARAKLPLGTTMKLRRARIGFRFKEADLHPSKEFVFYLIEAWRPNPKRPNQIVTWTVSRRYSQFHEMHGKIDAVRRKYNSSQGSLPPLPSFPPRTLRRSFDTDHIQFRKNALATWLSACLHKGYQQYVEDFLQDTITMSVL